MILDCLHESFQKLEDELRCSHNKELKTMFKEFDQCVVTNQRDAIVQYVIKSALIKTFTLGVWNQHYFEDKIIEHFDYLLSHIYETHQSITIKVSFQNHPQHLYRIIKLPYMIRLDDMCYSILAGFNVQECKQFSLEINQLNRYDCGQEIGENEMDQVLSSYRIHENSDMKFYYDFDQTYIFDIEVLSIEDNSTEEIEFLEGEGYGIWEEGIDYLDLYYQDKCQFMAFIHHKGLDIDDFLVDKCDLIHINNHILEAIETLKIKYSIKYQERKVFYEYLPFSFFINMQKMSKNILRNMCIFL